MREIRKVEVAKLKQNKHWIRQGKIDQAVINALAGSLKTHHQKIPIVVWEETIIDGHCRALAAPAAGLTHLEAVVFDHEPSEIELLETQTEIDIHRSSVPTTMRARALAAIKELRGCTVTELAQRMNVAQSECSKLLYIHEHGTSSLKRRLDEKAIDIEGAYSLAHKPAEEQDAVAAMPVIPGRDQLQRMLKANGKSDARASSVKLTLPGQVFITIKAPEISMQTLIEVLQEAWKHVKAAQRHGHDLTSLQRYLRETVNAGK